MNFMDIYSTIGNNLLENNYYDQDIEGKLELIDAGLRDYAISKILELDDSQEKVLSDTISINELIKILSDIIPNEKHFDTIRHFTHYILNIASSLQNLSIIWWSERNLDLIENPVVEFDINDKWSSITTHEKTPYLKTFEFAYETFKTEFISKNYRQSTKLLIQ